MIASAEQTHRKSFQPRPRPSGEAPWGSESSGIVEQLHPLRFPTYRILEHNQVSVILCY